AVLRPLLGVSAGVLGGLRKKLDIRNVESDPLRQALLEDPPYLVRIAVEPGQKVFPRNEQSQMLDRGTSQTLPWSSVRKCHSLVLTLGYRHRSAWRTPCV